MFLSKLSPEIRTAVQACKSHFTGSFLFSALINLLFLAPTIYMMQVYDRVVPTGGVLTLVWLTLILGFALGTLSFLDSVRTRMMVRAGLRADEALSSKILERLFQLKMSALEKSGRGQAMRDFDAVRQVLASPAMAALFDTPWTPIYLLVAFMLHPMLGLLICIGGAILVGLAILNERRLREGSKAGHAANARAYQTQEMLVARAPLVRALGMRSALINRQQASRQEGLIATAVTQMRATRYSALVKFVRMFLQSLALGLAAWLAVRGQISSGAIIAASVLLSRALQPIEQLVGAWPQMLQARQSLANLNALFLESADSTTPRMALPVPEGHISLANVTLRNPQATGFILRGVSLNLEPGKVVGLVGPSGAGKSSLARIIAGADTADVGELRIDGASYCDWDPEQLARHIGYLPQDSALFPGTIIENISRFAADVGDDANQIAIDVVEAAKLAGVHELILKLPDGYGTDLASGGASLSGGQAQRIALARALYGNPKVLVLDEPSSALDNEGEQALVRTLEAARAKQMAVLLIAHRSHILNLVDHLAVINDGTITASGPRDDVIVAMRSASERSNVVAMSQG